MGSEDVDVILHIIRDHPWCDAWQIAGLTGIPERTVYRWLGKMTKNGLVWHTRVGVPDVYGQVYALGRAGLIRLSGGIEIAEPYARAFGLHPTGLGQSLLRVRALAWVRNLLVSLLEMGQTLEWAITPARVTVGSNPLVLDGRGVVSPHAGRYLEFGVLADAGGASVRGWGKRINRFLSWAEKRCDEGIEAPVLILLTSQGIRAAKFVALWREVVESRAQSTYSRLFAAGIDDLMEIGGAAWMTSNGDKDRYLWEGAVGNARPVARLWPKLERSRGIRGALGACYLHGRLGGRAVLEAFQKITGEQWAMMEAVAGWPLLQGSELATLLGWQNGRASRAMKGLLDLGVVEATSLPGRESEGRLHLSPMGIQLLAATNGMGARHFGRARHWPVGQSGPVELKLGAFNYAVNHTLLAFKFVIGLRDLADWWWEAGYYHRLAIWDSSPEAVRYYYTRKGKLRYLLPDTGGVYQVGSVIYPFVLEVDRDRGHLNRLQEKFRRYYRARMMPGPLETGPFPRVLVLCATEGRARQVNQVICELAVEFDEPVLDAMITTLDRVLFAGARDEFDGSVTRIEHQGPGRPVEASIWPDLREWRLAGEDFDRVTWCFPELAPSRKQEHLRPMDLNQMHLEIRREGKMVRAQRARRRQERLEREV